jgi:hypothetical protein
MDITWQKSKQRIFTAKNHSSWMRSHVQNPCPIDLGDRIRIFFNTRPEPQNGLHTSHPTFIDVDRHDPSKIIEIAKHPVLDIGDVGCFDQHGCMTSSVIRQGEELWMYYVGWSRSVGTPYNWSIGLATSNDNGKHFSRRYKGPVVGSILNEPFLQNGCYVLKIGNIHHMWYSTGVEWIEVNGKFESRYLIVHASSNDGIHWKRNGVPIITLLHDDETQTTPTVFFHENKYHMLFSSRHSKDFRNKDNGYRLGYAWSDDLETWHRDDTRVGVTVSLEGWDSEMLCYPQVLQIDNTLLLFYCGNYFGVGGLGYAKYQIEPVS